MALSQVQSTCIETLDASKLTGSLPVGMGGGSALGADSIIRTNDVTITENLTFAGTENGMSSGPVAIGTGSTVTVTSPSVWTII